MVQNKEKLVVFKLTNFDRYWLSVLSGILPGCFHKVESVGFVSYHEFTCNNILAN